jgi:hypothetical protein
VIEEKRVPRTLRATSASRRTGTPAVPGGPRRRVSRLRALEQLTFDLGTPRPRWTFSRLVLASPHARRIRERLEFVRGFFPELDAVTVRVGLARKPGVLGWGSLDPDAPGVWVRPRRLDHFTIAHELTHLLQARGLVPRGERACDLWALARSALLVDAAPSYLRLPRDLARLRRLDTATSSMLHDAARRAIDARGRGDRAYLKRFEREVAATWRASRAGRAA